MWFTGLRQPTHSVARVRRSCQHRSTIQVLSKYNSTKAREGNFNVADVQYDAEPLKKDQEGTMAIMMQGGSHHLGKVLLIVITSENVIKRKIFGHERDPVITSPGLIVEDVIQLL